MVFAFALLLLAPPLQNVAFDVKLSELTEPGLPLETQDKFGQSAALVGDVNGDGFDDIVAGAPYADDGGTDRGAVHLLLLGANGTLIDSRTISDTQGSFFGVLDNDDLFGWSVAGLGDLDGDGIPDIAVGARHDDDGGTDRGAVWILFLRSNGTVKSYKKISETQGGFGGTLEDAGEFGWSVTSPGDIDGNGTPDLAVGIQQPVTVSNQWPGTSGTLISGGLPNNWEPSGAAWNPLTNRIVLVSDQGRVATMNPNGSGLEIASSSGDFEGVAIKDPSSTLIYIGIENPDSIREFDLATGQMTGKQWSLTPWMQGPSNAGLEALTYAHGQFYAGHENDGDIYVFNVSGTSNVSLDRVIPSPQGLQGLSGLHYEESTDTLYCLYRNRKVIEADLAGNSLREWSIIGLGLYQEGITLLTDCPSVDAQMVLAEDTGKVFRYDEYPVNCYGPEILPGRGAVWTLRLNSVGSVIDQVLLAQDSGGFGGQIGYGDRFGTSLAAAGDVDGDGIPDLAVGAPNDDDGGLDRGAVWIIELDADGSAKDEHKISHTSGGLPNMLEDNDQFGWSLAASGDIDGDGRVDLIAGTPGTDGSGSSLGAVDRLYLGPNGVVLGHDRLDESSLGGGLDSFDQFGTALVGNLDLNSDGRSDLVVGAAFDDDGGSNTGALWELFIDDGGSSITPYGCDPMTANTLWVESGTATAGTQLTLSVNSPGGLQSPGSLTLFVVAASPMLGYPCGVSADQLGLSMLNATGELLLGAQNAYPKLWGPTWTGPSQPASVSIEVPGGAEYLTYPLFVQAVIWDPSAAAPDGVELLLTNGLRIQIGL